MPVESPPRTVQTVSRFRTNAARTLALRRFAFLVAWPSGTEHSLGGEDAWPSGMDRMGIIIPRRVGMPHATVHWKSPLGIGEWRAPSDCSSGWSSGMASSAISSGEPITRSPATVAVGRSERRRVAFGNDSCVPCSEGIRTSDGEGYPGRFGTSGPGTGRFSYDDRSGWETVPQWRGEGGWGRWGRGCTLGICHLTRTKHNSELCSRRAGARSPR